jgi:hypothetical protein
MPGNGTKLLRSGLSAAEYDYVMAALTPTQRARALLAAADRASGKRWRELTAALSEQEDSALANWPVFVGGDSVDMERFIMDVWERPVTPENLRQTVEAFNSWYKIVCPDEYHEPERPEFMRDWQW